MYVKDNTIYPVALTQDQVNMFNLIQQVIPQPITVMKNHPVGEAVNLLTRKDNFKHWQMKGEKT